MLPLRTLNCKQLGLKAFVVRYASQLRVNGVELLFPVIIELSLFDLLFILDDQHPGQKFGE